MPFEWNVRIVWNVAEPLIGYRDVTRHLRRANWFLGAREPFANTGEEGTADIVLYNEGGLYTPESTTSVLAGKVLPGVSVVIRYTLDGGENYTSMWTGIIDDISIIPGGVGPNSTEEIAFRCIQWKGRLEDIDCTMGEIIGGVWKADDVIDAVVTDSGYSFNSTGDTGTTTLNLAGDYENRRGWTLIQQAAQSERGFVYFTRAGDLDFFNRYNFLLNTTSLGTVEDGSGDNNLRPLTYDYRYASTLANRVRVSVHPKTTAGGSETLWSLKSSIPVRAGQTYSFEAYLRDSRGERVYCNSLTASGAAWSTAAGDSNPTITITEQGSKCTVDLDATGNAETALLTALNLTGTPDYRNDNAAYVAEDSTSQTAYGLKALNIELPLIDSMTDAEGLALYELRRRKDPVGSVHSVTLFKSPPDGTNNIWQYTWVIGNRITVDIPNVKHTGDYFIIGEEHAIEPAAENSHTTTFYLQPAANEKFWVLGVAGYSELGETTWLGY